MMQLSLDADSVEGRGHDADHGRLRPARGLGGRALDRPWACTQGRRPRRGPSRQGSHRGLLHPGAVVRQERGRRLRLRQHAAPGVPCARTWSCCPTRPTASSRGSLHWGGGARRRRDQQRSDRAEHEDPVDPPGVVAGGAGPPPTRSTSRRSAAPTTGFCSLTEAASLLFVQFLDSPWRRRRRRSVAGAARRGIALRTDFFDRATPRSTGRARRARWPWRRSAQMPAVRAFWVRCSSSCHGDAEPVLDRLLVRARPGRTSPTSTASADNALGIGLRCWCSAAAGRRDGDGDHGRDRRRHGAPRRDRLDHGVPARARPPRRLGASPSASSWSRCWPRPGGCCRSPCSARAPGGGAAATELEDEGVRADCAAAPPHQGRRIRSMLVGGFLVWLAFSLPNGVGAVVLLLTGWPFFVTDVISVGGRGVRAGGVDRAHAALLRPARRRPARPPAGPSPMITS